ncbi:hypothetical protein [Agromyces atrinae]|uniref:Tfp pilus assembly protein PilX n=1 Tax=Agromyces atrinae TaxID=592376 RepID=A0A4Q2M886_9MICO|nr:hypothetical protein [Agromyces atrinae]NYD66900.1 Tfp pilus assembly protein PilX [Agromyces atrinae]RXZ87547.1 hypothetical protein ESP50_06430 [Agromyces atrinae]
MLLTRLLRRARSTEGESGSALLAVIAVMGVTAILLVVFGLVTVNNLGNTSAHRAGVQAQAAAEAGLADTLAKLQSASTPCSSGVYTASTPGYTAKVYVRSGTGAFSTTPSCPVTATTAIRIVSTGTAANAGVAGNDRGDTRTVTAEYPITPSASTTYAIYIHRTDSVSSHTTNIGEVKLTTSAGRNAGVYFNETTDFTCSPRMEIQGDLILSQAGAKLNAGASGCTVKGNVFSKGSVLVANQGRVEGGVWSVGASSVTSPGVVLGGVHTATAPPASVPWVDVTGDPASWTGYSRWPSGWAIDDSGECQHNEYIRDQINSFTTPTVIDARGCGYEGSGVGGFKLKNGTYTLKTNVAIIAYDIQIGDGTTFSSSSSSTDRRLHFISPDTTVSTPTKPDCRITAGGNYGIRVEANVRVNAPVAAMLYSPCRIQMGGNLNWRGSLYAAAVNFTGGTQNFFYEPMSIPGSSISGGGGGGTTGPGGIGPATSYRDGAP